MNDLENILLAFSKVSDNNQISLFLYGDDKFNDTRIKKIVMSNIRFVKDSQRFDEQPFWQYASLNHFFLLPPELCADIFVFHFAEEGLIYPLKVIFFNLKYTLELFL